MPPLPEAIILVLASFAPLFSHRVWPHAQRLLLGAILAPGARTVTAALRAMGLATERRFTNDHRVLNRATWSARQGSRILLDLLVALLVPRGRPSFSGRTIRWNAGLAGRSRRKGVTGMRCDPRTTCHVLFRPEMGRDDAPGPGALEPTRVGVAVSHRVVSACRRRGRRRHKTSMDWVRQMMQQVRRWLPGRRLVLVVDGGFAAVALALACVKSRVGMVSRVRWDAALYHPPGLQPPGKRGRKPPKGSANGACRAGRSTPIPPGKLWRWTGTAASGSNCGSSRARPCGTPPACPPWTSVMSWSATPKGSCAWKPSSVPTCRPPRSRCWQWVVRRWSVEVTFEEARASSRPGDPAAMVGPSDRSHHPVLLALYSLITVLALQLSQRGQIPVSVAAWYHKAEPTFTDCLALVRGQLWHARYLVNSAAEAEFVQFPREVFELLLTGLSLAA